LSQSTLIFIYTQEDSPSGNKITHLHITARAFTSQKRTTDVLFFQLFIIKQKQQFKRTAQKIKKVL
jgi:hypothetical protein